MIEVIILIVVSFGLVGCFLATVGKSNNNKIADRINIEEVELIAKSTKACLANKGD